MLITSLKMIHSFHGLYWDHLKGLLALLTLPETKHKNNTAGIVSQVNPHPRSDLPLNFSRLTFPMDLNLSFCVVSLTLISQSDISHVL